MKHTTKNLYETAEIVEAGAAHKLIQGVIKDHLFVLECRSCIDAAYSQGDSEGDLGDFSDF